MNDFINVFHQYCITRKNILIVHFRNIFLIIYPPTSAYF